LVYGNVFLDTWGKAGYSDAVIFMGDDRSSQGGGPQNCSGCKVFNNTFVGMARGQVGLKFTGIKTNTEARNNIWYGLGAGTYPGCMAADCSNNYVLNSMNSGAFVNSAAGDFRLTSDGAAGAGYALSAPYNEDMYGNQRGTGTWDVGAFEYTSSGVRIPGRMEEQGSVPPNPLTRTDVVRLASSGGARFFTVAGNPVTMKEMPDGGVLLMEKNNTLRKIVVTP
jgi:hypothetical protein